MLLAVLATSTATIALAPDQATAIYATGGSGLYKGSIDWFDWGTPDQAIPVTGTTRTDTRTVAGQTLSTTCSITNVEGGGIRTYRPGTWVGDAFDDLYNIGGTGTNNTMTVGLVSAQRGTASDFHISCAVTLDGLPVPLQGLVIADAEESTQGEYIQATPDQAATWRIIDRYRECGTSTIATLANDGTLRLSPNGAQCHDVNGGAGPTTVGFMQGSAGAQIEELGIGNTAIAFGVVLEADYGDAPSSYGSAGALFDPGWNGGTVPVGSTDVSSDSFALGAPGNTPSPRLGATEDAEGSPAFSAAADGDGSDEDAITPPGNINVVRGQTYTLRNVACTGPGSVAGWIDWNRNGAFDSGEQSGVAVCANGSVDLSWTVPADTAEGATFLRLRIAGATAEAALPTGLSTSGEVEDYPLTVTPEDPKLSLVKSVDPATVEDAGDPVTFSFAVTNDGNVPVSGVTINEKSFSGTGALSAIQCPATTLEAGATTTCTATYATTQADIDAGTIANSATASGSAPSGAPVESELSTATVSAPATPALALKKSADPDTPDSLTLNRVVTYSFAVTNTGNVTISDVAVDDKTFTGSGALSPISCPPGTTALAPGATVTCTATYTVTQADVDNGRITNTATASGTDPSGGPVQSAPDSVTIPKALKLRLSRTPGPPVLAATGTRLSLPATFFLAMAALFCGACLVVAARPRKTRP